VKKDHFKVKAKDMILKCFQEIPFLEINSVDIEPNLGGMRPDLRISLQYQGKVLYIVAELENNGEPRYAHQAVNQIFRYLQEARGDYGVFIAPYISSRSAEICREENVGYVDLAGNCHISFGNIYIHKEGTPNPFTRKRYLRSLFSPKSERVLRVLLTSGPKKWKMEELAREANVSMGQVFNVKKLLADQEWIDDTRPIGFSLIDPFALLDEWSRSYNYRRNEVLNYYTLSGIGEFEYRLGEVCQEKNILYGLTGFSGSARYVPVVRYQRVMAYVQDGFDELANTIGIKTVDSGANVTLLKPYDEGVFYGSEERNDDWVVSPVQIYLDLQGYRGRGEEAAEALRIEVIHKLWLVDAIIQKK